MTDLTEVGIELPPPLAFPNVTVILSLMSVTTLPVTIILPRILTVPDPSTNLYLKDINTAPANLANIILMANDGFILDSGNGVNTNFFGNLIGNNVSGGRGSSSGKFNGSGTVITYMI